jgi:DNA (cytosine-5)-methyltransferase 1
MKKIRFIDLFAGTGGIRLAFEKALLEHGYEPVCVKSAEIDPRACETYELNFGVNPQCDVKSLDRIPPFDALLAGFPCQAFSYAGKQLGFADTRGTLFFEVERILKKYKPSFCFLENVRGLTTHDGGKTFQTILKHLCDLGYKVEYRLINASSMGVPQNRTRIYIVCTLNVTPVLTLDNDLGASDSHSFKLQEPNLWDYQSPKKDKLVKDILEDNPDSSFDCSAWFCNALSNAVNGDLNQLHGKRLIDTRHGNSIHSWDLGQKGICSKKEISFMNMLVSNRRRHVFGTHQDGKALTIEQIKTFYHDNDIEQIISSLLCKGYLKVDSSGRYNPVCGNMSFEVFKFLDPESISITLTSSDANRLGIYHNGRIRRITPRECARLQGYPDSYVLHPQNASSYKQLGNAVCVPVIQQVISNLLSNTPDVFLSEKKGHSQTFQ